MGDPTPATRLDWRKVKNVFDVNVSAMARPSRARWRGVTLMARGTPRIAYPLATTLAVKAAGLLPRSLYEPLAGLRNEPARKRLEKR